MSNITFKIVTPNGVKYDKETQFIQLPGKGQEMGIELDHSPTIAELNPGKVMVEIDEETQEIFFIPNGFCYIRDNKVTVMARIIPKIPKKFPRLEVSGDDSPLKANIKRMPANKYNIAAKFGDIIYFLFFSFFCTFATFFELLKIHQKY